MKVQTDDIKMYLNDCKDDDIEVLHMGGSCGLLLVRLWTLKIWNITKFVCLCIYIRSVWTSRKFCNHTRGMDMGFCIRSTLYFHVVCRHRPRRADLPSKDSKEMSTNSSFQN